MIEIPTQLVFTIIGWILFIGVHVLLVGLFLMARKEERMLLSIIMGLFLLFIWIIMLTIIGVIVWV